MRPSPWPASIQPTAITLDIFLPDMLGWTVLNNLKLDPATRHIPVQIISVEEERQHGLAHGAFSYMVKPATTEGLEQCLRSHQRISSTPRDQTTAGGGGQRNRAQEHRRIARATRTSRSPRRPPGPRRCRPLLDRPFDCCVLDLRLPDMTGFELLDKLQAEPNLREMPIVVFTGKELTPRGGSPAASRGQEHRAQGRAVARTAL